MQSFFCAFFFTASVIISFIGEATAQSTGQTYSLFNPKPAGELRELNTDRPDITESAYTVDAGHFQFELSFAEYHQIRDADTREHEVDVLPANLKVGLTDNTDVQLIFDPYERDSVKTSQSSERSEGFSDETEIRLKTNFWGNDGGDTAFGIMPFIKVPTGSHELSNNHVEGGIILPFAISLPNDFDLSTMLEGAVRYNDDDDSYGQEFVHTASLGHSVFGLEDMDAYLEYAGIQPNDLNEHYQAIASTGLTYKITANIQIDIGGTFSLNHDLENNGAFTGISIRI